MYSFFKENYLQITYNYLGLSKSFEDDTSDDQEVPENLIRNFRPPHLEFSVGNVILTHTMMAGIIIGWNIDKAVSIVPTYLYSTKFNISLFQSINTI